MMSIFSTNRTCIIIGNGPSLNEQLGQSIFNRYFTLGSNKIFLANIMPNVYCAVNDIVIKQSLDHINNMDSVKFITDRQSSAVAGSIPLVSLPAGVFSKNPLQGICEGSTVTYVLLQIAYWLGYKKVGLIGVDHKYKFTGLPNEESICPEIDENHFFPNYFGGQKWNNLDLENSEKSYEFAKYIYEQDERSIINLTPGSELNVFPKEDWRTW
jgi:hypothetical protein